MFEIFSLDAPQGGVRLKSNAVMKVWLRTCIPVVFQCGFTAERRKPKQDVSNLFSSGDPS